MLTDDILGDSIFNSVDEIISAEPILDFNNLTQTETLPTKLMETLHIIEKFDTIGEVTFNVSDLKSLIIDYNFISKSKIENTRLVNFIVEKDVCTIFARTSMLQISRIKCNSPYRFTFSVDYDLLSKLLKKGETIKFKCSNEIISIEKSNASFDLLKPIFEFDVTEIYEYYNIFDFECSYNSSELKTALLNLLPFIKGSKRREFSSLYIDNDTIFCKSTHMYNYVKFSNFTSKVKYILNNEIVTQLLRIVDDDNTLVQLKSSEDDSELIIKINNKLFITKKVIGTVRFNLDIPLSQKVYYAERKSLIDAIDEINLYKEYNLSMYIKDDKLQVNNKLHSNCYSWMKIQNLTKNEGFEISFGIDLGVLLKVLRILKTDYVYIVLSETNEHVLISDTKFVLSNMILIN